MQEPCMVEQHGEYTVKFYVDVDAESPRKNSDHLGTFYMAHGRLAYGDENFTSFLTLEHSILLELEPDSFDMEDEGILEMINSNAPNWEEGELVILPVYMYQHGVVAFSTDGDWPFNDRWDSGLAGYIFASYSRIKKEYGKEEIDDESIEKAISVLKAEISELSSYAQGDIYGVVVEKDGEPGESCWGLIGLDHARETALNELLPTEE